MKRKHPPSNKGKLKLAMGLYITRLLKPAAVKKQAGLAKTQQKVIKVTRKDKTPYPEALYCEELKPCFVCRKLTHWVEVDYQGFICSAKCLQKAAPRPLHRPTHAEIDKEVAEYIKQRNKEV